MLLFLALGRKVYFLSFLSFSRILFVSGPGIVSRPDHHAPPDPASPNLVPIDILRSVGTVCFSPSFSSLPAFSTHYFAEVGSTKG